MAKTLEEVQRNLREQNTHKITPGRGSAYNIPDVVNKGRLLLSETTRTGENIDDHDTAVVEVDDIVGEL
jgi:hypothetical protein